LAAAYDGSRATYLSRRKITGRREDEVLQKLAKFKQSIIAAPIVTAPGS
jgi:hypothetical protein